MDIFTESQFSEDIPAFSALVNSKSLKRDILVIVDRKTDLKGKITQRLIISTDINMYPLEVLECYYCRFQMEFNLRVAKQAAGLNQSKPEI
jgi:hypothetical protein